MYDETQTRIINATMKLIMESGYSSTTTKNIARAAEVNECTIFRRFKGKKDIVLAAMELPEWNPSLKEEDFFLENEPTSKEEIIDHLIHFSNIYMDKVTPQMVKVSIGLRTPELQDVTIPGIMKVPQTFKKVLIDYLGQLEKHNFIKTITTIHKDSDSCTTSTNENQNQLLESLAIQFLAMNFGFVFFHASFGENLIGISKEEYIRNSVTNFVNGMLA